MYAANQYPRIAVSKNERFAPGSWGSLASAAPGAAPRRRRKHEGDRAPERTGADLTRPRTGDGLHDRLGPPGRCRRPGDRQARTSHPRAEKPNERRAASGRTARTFAGCDECLERPQPVARGSDAVVGAGDGIRTRDILLGKQTLCQLSYSRSGGAPNTRFVRAGDYLKGRLPAKPRLRAGVPGGSSPAARLTRQPRRRQTLAP